MLLKLRSELDNRPVVKGGGAQRGHNTKKTLFGGKKFLVLPPPQLEGWLRPCSSYRLVNSKFSSSIPPKALTVYASVDRLFYYFPLFCRFLSKGRESEGQCGFYSATPRSEIHVHVVVTRVIHIKIVLENTNKVFFS